MYSGIWFPRCGSDLTHGRVTTLEERRSGQFSTSQEGGRKEREAREGRDETHLTFFSISTVGSIVNSRSRTSTYRKILILHTPEVQSALRARTQESR